MAQYDPSETQIPASVAGMNTQLFISKSNKDHLIAFRYI